MTTKFKIEITEEHNPLVIKVVPALVHQNDVLPSATLRKKGDSYEAYLHSGARVVFTEDTNQLDS